VPVPVPAFSKATMSITGTLNCGVMQQRRRFQKKIQGNVSLVKKSEKYS
jgi:hypothetical protein